MKKVKNRKNITDVSQAQENKRSSFVAKEDRCILCGAVVPEGRMVCWGCENEFTKKRCVICNKPIEGEDSICKHCSTTIFSSIDKTKNES